jgi:hypothetical protein
VKVEEVEAKVRLWLVCGIPVCCSGTGLDVSYSGLMFRTRPDGQWFRGPIAQSIAHPKKVAPRRGLRQLVCCNFFVNLSAGAGIFTRAPDLMLQAGDLSSCLSRIGLAIFCRGLLQSDWPEFQPEFQPDCQLDD